MFNKLNGWQRLWVVFSIFLLIMFACYAYYIISHDRVNEGKCMAEFDVRWSESHPPNEKGFRSKPSVFDPYLDTEYNSCIKKEQIMFVAKIILIWLVVIIFFYGVGFSVAWVRNGF